MSKIVTIKKHKKNVDIIFDDNRKISLDYSTIEEYKLYINKELSHRDLINIKRYSKNESYFEKALCFIKRGCAVPKKISNFLIKKGANKSQIDYVIDKLRKTNLIDEKEITNQIIEKYKSKHYGKNRIIQELYKRGISEQIIKSVKERMFSDDEDANLLVKKLLCKYENRNYSKTKQLVLEAMIRAGYNEEKSRTIIEENFIYNPQHEQNMLKLDYLKYFSRFSRNYKGDVLNSKIVTCLQNKGYNLTDIKEIINNEVDKRIS